MTKLRVLDLFSGIGGFSLGLERTGKFETIAFSEIDPYASKVLGKWWPSVPNFSHGIVGLNALLKRVRTSSPRVSLAKISHSLARAPDLPAPVQDSFGHSCEPFAWFDPASRSWRTWQRCLLEGWATFSGTWPRSGMTRNGIAYRRPPLVPLTRGTESGSLLPTPRAEGMDAMGSGKHAADSLLIQARTWQLPTPTAVDGRRGTGTYRPQDTGVPLPQAVAMSLATPTASPWRSGKASAATHEKNSRPLSEQIGGSLNPTWVEWLMGFPLGWTDLGASGMPSSRISRNSSGK